MVHAAQKAATLINTAHAAHATREHLPCTCTTTSTSASAVCRHHRPPVGVVLADAGYLSAANLTAPGPDRLIATGKHRTLLAAATDHTTDHATAGPATSSGASPEPDPLTDMATRLRTPEGIALYNQRGHIAETPHGHLKHNLNFRQLTMRGLTKASAEWTFVCATANLFKALGTLTSIHDLPALTSQ